MRLIITFMVAVVVCVQPLAMAQTVSPNINVLPLVLPQESDDWYLLGDGYLQRQVEPSIAVSTRNPDHLITFFNDYRAIDVEIDEAPPDPFPVIIAALKLSPPTMMWAGLLENVWPLMKPPVASAEAWVGMSTSYDGGLTWLGGMLPGGPFDNTDPSEASPVFGRQAATDPVAGAAPCGYVYVVFVAFTRGDESSLAVARYRDLNNDESGDTWVYDGTWLIETGNNATHGYFLDKPFLAVDHDRTGANACGSTIYVSYTTFNGFDHDGNFQSKVHVAKSTDNAETWDKIKVNKTYGQGQGTAIAIDPRSGVPSDPNGGGTIYVAFRHFFDPDAILVTKSTDFAKKFSAPVEITEGTNMYAYDQPTITSQMTQSPRLDLTFRSNAFPTLAVAGNGNVFAAWQERVNIDSANGALGVPRPYDPDELYPSSPRIVAMKSADAGETWESLVGPNGEPSVAGQRRAADFGDRDDPVDPNTPDAGYGALPHHRASGPQVKPRLVFGGGQLMLGYVESRGYVETNDTLLPDDISDTGFASGYNRVFDFRTALLHPADGHLLSTTQVSRYPLSPSADLSDGEDVADIAPINPPCSPDYDDVETGLPPCVRQLNFKNRPQSGAGTAPFMGDYADATSILPFVPDGYGGWRWATNPDDVPYQGFRVVFADNRHLVPPTYDPNQDEIDRYPNYDPPETGHPSCTNTGSRNTDVLTARVDTDLVLSTPTSYKQLDARRSFPFTVSNRTDQIRYYQLTVIDPDGLSSFSPDPDAPEPEMTGNITVFRYSSVAQVVYVDYEEWADPERSIRVEVVETDSYGVPIDDPQTGVIVFNADPSNPSVASLPGDEVQNPFAENPFYENPFYENPFYENPFYENPFYENPFYENPFFENPFYENQAIAGETIYDIIDTTWTVTAGGSNTASSYLALVNIDNAAQFTENYAFQLIIYKNSGFASAEGCEAFGQPEPIVLSNVVNDPQNPFYENPFYENPFYENPFYENPFYENPFYENSTFALAPSDAYGESTLKSMPGDDPLQVPRGPDRVSILLRAYQLVEDPGDFVFNPDPDLGGDSPALTVIYRGCNTNNPNATCFFTTAPDLVPKLKVDDSTPLDPIYLPADYKVTAPAGGTLTGFPAGGWDLYNQKLANQTFGDAIAENGFLRHGFHICETGYIEKPPAPLDWDEKPLDLSECRPIAQTLPNVDCETNPISQCTILELGESDWFAPIDLSIPTMYPGDYYIVLYADQEVEVSERNEVNNWVAVPITITNPPPVAVDDSLTVDENSGPTIVDVLVNDWDPNDDPPVVIAVGPAGNGTALFTDGIVTYQPHAGFTGSDSFEYSVQDIHGGTDTATVFVTVIPVSAEWLFIGFDNPWEPYYEITAGSAVPLKWHYENPDTGQQEPCYNDALSITATGWDACDEDGAPTGDQSPQIELPGEDAGSSSLRCINGAWQLNWDTVNQSPGCYFLSIHHSATNQTNTQNADLENLTIVLQ